MSFSLNSLKGIIQGTTTGGVIKGDTRSLDSGSCKALGPKDHTINIFWAMLSFRVNLPP